MDFRLFVALIALVRSAAECLVRMTIAASDSCMRSIEHEKTIMIKIAQSIDAVMAGQAH